MTRTKSKPEASRLGSQFAPNSSVCIKAIHPLWAGECCTVVARPSSDAAIVELRSGDREYIALRYLQSACIHKFYPVWQTNGTLVERCGCGETRPPLPSTLTSVLEQLTKARNEQAAIAFESSGNRQLQLSQTFEDVEHQIKWLSEQVEQMNGQAQGSTYENSETVESTSQVPIANCKRLVPSKTETVEVLPAVMTEVEARQCISEIKSHLTSIRVLVLDLEERCGWEALGYTSMTACLVSEFPSESKTKLIRALEAGRIERYLQQVPIGTYLESQLRPLNKLPSQQWQLALSTAHQLAGNAKLTAIHVTKAVNEILSSARFVKQTTPLPYKQNEHVRIQCQLGALPEQKVWDGCWGIVKSTGNICAVTVSVGDQEIDYMASDLDWEENSDPQFRNTCDRILVLWQKAELEPVEENLLKFWQRRHFFTKFELEIVALVEAKIS